MLNLRKNLSTLMISTLSVACLTLGIATPASSQLLPEVWGSIGTQDDDLSYAGGVKWSGFAVEVGTGKEGATGGDFLAFFPLPIVSPYVGLGAYSGDDTLAYSGGVHFTAGRVILGAGYHSIRGINGKLGFKF